MEQIYIRTMYLTNENFKRYLDKYMKNNNMTIDEAIEQKVVQIVASSYSQGGCNENTKLIS